MLAEICKLMGFGAKPQQDWERSEQVFGIKNMACFVTTT